MTGHHFHGGSFAAGAASVVLLVAVAIAAVCYALRRAVEKLLS